MPQEKNEFFIYCNIVNGSTTNNEKIKYKQLQTILNQDIY